MTDERRLRWLVTAGPTCEDIDPVRFITNRSSGRMGYAVARAAVELGSDRGDEVTLVSGPVALDAPAGCDFVRVRSARDMFDAVTARFDSVDVVVMAAAVADFRPVSPSGAKIKRTRAGLVLRLEPTVDILAELGRRKRSQMPAQVLIGFALEAPKEDAPAPGTITPAMRELAERKLLAKKVDAICLNGPGAIDREASTLSVLVRKPGGEAGWNDWGELPKEEHAQRLVDLAAGLALSR